MRHRKIHGCLRKEPVESTKIDYPVINELEKEVFKKEFKEQNIKTRLSNLEKKTLGKTYENDDYHHVLIG